MMPLPGPVGQVALVVRDLERAAAAWSPIVRGAGWRVWTYGSQTLRSLTYRGAPGTFRMRIALAGSDPQIELIEPLDGPSVFHEHLERHGEGLHHVGIYVPDAAAAAAASGFAILQDGHGFGADGSGAFVYLDTVAAHGTIVELIEVPRERRPPEAVLP